MMRILLYAATALVAAHGLVHLMGFVAYFPLATVLQLPYKTTLADGYWEVGCAGMRLYALLWLLAALGFLAAAFGIATHQAWLTPVMLATIGLSTVLIALDWAAAFRGAVINVAILVLMAWTLWLPRVGATQ